MERLCEGKSPPTVADAHRVCDEGSPSHLRQWLYHSSVFSQALCKFSRGRDLRRHPPDAGILSPLAVLSIGKPSSLSSEGVLVSAFLLFVPQRGHDFSDGEVQPSLPVRFALHQMSCLRCRCSSSYVFLPALAKVVETSNGNISVLLNRHASLQAGEGEPQLIRASKAEMPVEWNRLLKTYDEVKPQLASGGEYKRIKVRPPLNLTLYPLEVCVKLVRHYSDDVDAVVVRAVEQFWRQVHPEQVVAHSEEEEESKGSGLEGLQIQRQDSDLMNGELVIDNNLSSRMKREPVSYLQFPTIMKGHRIIIDLTRIGEGDGDADSENVDALLSALSDNFLASVPPASVDLPLKRIYRLSDDEISVTLKDQCIKLVNGGLHCGTGQETMHLSRVRPSMVTLAICSCSLATPPHMHLSSTG